VDKTPKACIHRFPVDSRYALNPPYEEQPMSMRHIIHDMTLVLQIINDETLFEAYPHPRADEPQALSAE
jgi:hypothetical protein